MAAEQRAADGQQALAALAGQITQLRAGGLDAGAIKQAVEDALVERV